MTSSKLSPLSQATITAFRLFLERKPDPAHPPQYAHLQELHRMLQRSEEFRTSPRAVKTKLGWPLSQVFVSRPAKVIYCPIGKNACTFLKSEVTRTAGLAHIDHIARDIHFITDTVRTGMQLSDHSPQEVERLIHDETYLRFAVLRDPMDRLLSAYVEKFVQHRNTPLNIFHTRSVVDPVQAAVGLDASDYDRGITFRDFIEHVTSVDATTLDPHWRPQAHYLQGITYDRLFRMDQINDLMEILEARSGVSLGRQARNVTGSGKGTDQPGAQDLLPAQIEAGPKLSKASFFDTDMRQAVESAFASDYSLL